MKSVAFVESFAGNPSFRPRFRYYHWLPALAGGAGCVVTAFLIDPWAAALAAILLAFFYFFLRRRVLRVHFGDARWGFIYSRLRSNLLKLAKLKNTPKNWRPSILVLTGDPEANITKSMYALWIGAQRGLVTLVRILTGDILELSTRRGIAKDQLNRFIVMVVISHLLTLNYEWSGATIRLFRLIKNEEGREPATQALRGMIDTARIDADAQIIVFESPFAEVLHRHSSDASVVFLGFIMPQEEEAHEFQARYEEMLSGLPTALLFYSSGEADLMA